jgi:N-acyl-phosphatidylethanolamine-hydrolysing phospholipase D
LKRWFLLALASAMVVVASLHGCATTNPDFNSAKAHHTVKGFRNNYADVKGKPLGDLLSWQFNAKKQGLPKPPSQVVKGYQFPLVQPDFAALAAAKLDPAKVTLTWIGHSTALIQMSGLNVLSDPHFTERASPLAFAGPKRKTAIPITLQALPTIDAVVISHNHYDHLDTGSIKQLIQQAGGEPTFFAPLGVDRWLKEQGASKVIGLDWWEQAKLGAIEFHLVPVQHWSARSPFDSNATLWGGWVVKSEKFKWFFAGDTGYSKDFKDIHARFGDFDLAVIPLGAYEPRWFMADQHVNPAEAVQIHLDVGARQSIGIHWGTFELADESLDQPLLDLAEALDAAKVPRAQFITLNHGQTKVLR